MAEQELNRAAPPLRQRLGGSGDTPGTAYNRILIDFVDITLRMQQFGRDSIGPNHEMYEYSRGILERSTGRLVDIAFSSTQAFGFSVDGVVPPDDVAGFHAMDVLQHFELVPEAAAITRNLKKIVEFLCERKCLFCLDSDSLRESCGVYVSSHLLEWLWNVALDALPYQSETLASHADAFVTCIEEGWDPHDYVEERIVLTAAMAFKHMPSAIIARHASTFLDILQDLDKYGDDCIVLDAAMEVLDLMDSALLAASCLDELLLMLDPSKNICVYGCQVALKLLAKLGPVVTVARADPIVACLRFVYCFTTFRRLGDEPNETFRVDEDDYQVRAQAIRVLSNISINEYADAIAACLEQDHRDVRIAALEALSTLSPASLANYSAAIVHHLKNPPPNSYFGSVQKASLDTLSKLDLSSLGAIAHVVAEYLDNEDGDTRFAALQALSKLAPASLSVFGAAIAARPASESEILMNCVTAKPPSDEYYKYTLARSRVACCRNQMAALDTLSKLEPNSLIEHADTLSWLLKCDSPPATSDELTLLKEKYPDEPSLADVKARANEMLDALYMPGGSGSDAAKASFEAQAQAMGT